MDYLTARIISEAGYGKLQGDIDKDLQQEILISNKANENEVSQSKQNFTNLLKPQGTQNNPLASNVTPQAKDNSTLQNLGRNVININDNSLQATQDSTIAKPNPTSTYNSNIVLSSDPNFKPQTSQFANLKDSKNSNSNPLRNKLTPHKRLGNVISDLDFYNHLGYGSNSMRYRDLVAKYQEVNPLAKEYNITDYLSLAKYYDLQSSEIPSSNS